MSGAVALRPLLETLGQQMHRLAAMGGEIEEAVGRTIGASAGAGAETAALQKLDNLVQSLQGVAAYVEGLAREVDGAQRVEPAAALAAVHQRSLATALAGAGPCTAESGSADFF